MDLDSFIVYLETDGLYQDMAEDLWIMNYELDQCQKEKIKK